MLPEHVSHPSPAGLDIERPQSSSIGGTHNSSPETGRAIVRLANTVWEAGVEPIISQMAQLITPLSSVYGTVWTDGMKAHVTETANFSFVLTKVDTLYKDVEDQEPPEKAKFAVVFSIHTEPPFDSLALAYLLLEFPRRYYAEGKGRFFLLDLCYELGMGGVHGVLFYDGGLAHVHDKIIPKKVNDPEDLYYLDYNNKPHMVFTWNHDLLYLGPPFAVDSHFEECLEIGILMLQKEDF
ncbi:hypothetical protein EST38_g6962 [Candolleomyces aberdarensis]|uniref:Uncharacterized protein n=1 Tax=Candolleomyces aberdarensis TaxID=2316362 RepID=A0A4Q2DGV3_9AGAR|nr:hypothetical protein EST38_g6962 [Candolleomyces aberdarensis]